ncbi:MAG: creatininase family protein [Chloroflexi bacterium]|nr:creatininase family protein [Ardenticatenaceae bacterium]MBL1131022.1 creatininase family protein [Chloroflexota bacterium]NOG37120.1 creatininase family protein [Chloroflexota bacterium]
MQWEQLTSLDFAAAVQQCQGVGIIPIGVLEAHASHLPLGTDIFTAHFVACRAAAQETAVIFPAYPFSINHETAHLPGGLVIKRDLAFALLENICDEMYRNGLNKIILISGHGGNRFFLPLFVQTLPEKRKPYVVYYADLPVVPMDETILEHPENGHACEAETSMIRYIDDSLVKMAQIPARPFANLHRNQPLADAGGYSPMDWYAMYPHMYVGDAHKATAAKGEKLLNFRVARLVDLIRAVKADNLTPELLAEFNARQASPTAPNFWVEGD